MNYSTILDLFFSLLGGVLGAAIGGLNAYILCGLSLIIGTIINLFSSHPSSANIISWGPFLGPHVAFAGGVAGAAYAAAAGKISTGRDIVTRLARFNSPMIYVVGGVFGVGGYLLKIFADMIPPVQGIPWINSIAFSITVNAIVVRLLFGKSGLFNRFKNPYGSWQPWRYGSNVFIIFAAGLAAISASVIHQYPSMLGIMFGIASLSLLLLYFRMKIPIVLHIGWAAEFTAFLSGDIGWGIAFGILAAIIGEICAHLFLVDGDTHIDPPAMSLAIVFSIYPMLVNLGWIEALKPYSYAIAALMVMAGFMVFNLRENQPQKNPGAGGSE
jgi:hypothetical protein